MFQRLTGAAMALCFIGVLSAQALAQTAPPTRIRGTIAAFVGQTLTIDSRDGQKLEVALADNVTVATVKKVELASIAAGSYIGTATRTGAGGKLQAIEVLVFPEAMRGAGEGHYAWDLEPGSMMTNGTIDGVTAAAVGRELTVSYKGGNVSVYVPPDAPVVTFAPAEKGDLKPGAPVFLSAAKNAEGRFTAARVTVGKDGVAPPM
ncbi:MAG: hypothetical protein WCI94_13520 [Rhodospirillales bacterium]